MNLQAIKDEHLRGRHQLVAMDREGVLLESDECIMPLAGFKGTSILEAMVVFTGMHELILGLEPGGLPLQIPMMEFRFNEQDYHLGMEFWASWDGETILWLMSRDHGPGQRLQELQQERNETHLGMERVSEQEQTLREYTRRLEQAHHALQRFSYIVSHDLKAPLRAIGNLADWIREAIQEENYQELPEYLELLGSRVKRMADLIDGIMRYHRAGREPVQLEPIDMAALLTELFETIFQGVKCELVLPPKLPVIQCCRIRVYQVFSNLFQNALKYADAAERRLEVRYKDEGDWHLFAVMDNGPGIDPKHHGRVFEIFQTLQSKDDDESTGIGLSIVQRLVTESGGDIWIESALGQGATFWFRLPKKIAS